MHVLDSNAHPFYKPKNFTVSSYMYFFGGKVVVMFESFL